MPAIPGSHPPGAPSLCPAVRPICPEDAFPRSPDTFRQPTGQHGACWRPPRKARPGRVVLVYLPEPAYACRGWVRRAGSPGGGRPTCCPVARAGGQEAGDSIADWGLWLADLLWARLPARCTQTGRQAGRRCRGPGRPHCLPRRFGRQVGHLQDRDAGRELVQAAPADCLLHGEDAPDRTARDSSSPA